MKNYSKHGLKTLVITTALTASVASTACEVAKFTEIPVTDAYHNLAVSNNGEVAFVRDYYFSKWSVAKGLTNLGPRNTGGTSTESNITKAHISTDGTVAGFTNVGQNIAVDAVIYTGTTKRTVSYQTLYNSATLSSDGKVLGGVKGQNNVLTNPATFNLATNILTSDTDPSVQGFIVRDLSSNGAFKLVGDGYAFYWVNSAGTKTLVPGGAVDLSNDGLKVVTDCNDYTMNACIWDSSTRTTKTLGNFYPANYAANLDASVVVGFDATNSNDLKGVIWDAINGARDIKTVLGLKGVNISAWSNIVLHDISDDGKYVVGRGKNPSGVVKPFLAQLK